MLLRLYLIDPVLPLLQLSLLKTLRHLHRVDARGLKDKINFLQRQEAELWKKLPHAVQTNEVNANEHEVDLYMN